jgi:Meiotically Up-regulated Gene 113 (MUG113) protein
VTESYTWRSPVLLRWDQEAEDWALADGSVCMARWASGGITHARGDVCGQQATREIGDIPVCQHHYDRAGQWAWDAARKERRAIERARQSLDDERKHLDKALDRRDKRRREMTECSRAAELKAASLIYYIMRSDRLIKIGTTARVTARMRTLEDQYGEIRLLLTHPGDRQAEQQLHREFSAWRWRGEWFHPGKPLIEHIRLIRQQQGRRRPEVEGTVTRADLLALTKGALSKPPPGSYVPPSRSGRYRRNQVA